MRLITLLILCGFLLPAYGWGQTTQTTKIYLNGNWNLETIHNTNDPVIIGNITLLETNLDSLGFQIFKDKIVYVPFTPGKTYYFYNEGGANIVSWMVSYTEQEFWLTINRVGVRKYRHYFLDKKTGLTLLEEKK